MTIQIVYYYIQFIIGYSILSNHNCDCETHPHPPPAKRCTPIAIVDARQSVRPFARPSAVTA